MTTTCVCGHKRSEHGMTACTKCYCRLYVPEQNSAPAEDEKRKDENGKLAQHFARCVSWLPMELTEKGRLTIPVLKLEDLFFDAIEQGRKAGLAEHPDIQKAYRAGFEQGWHCAHNGKICGADDHPYQP